jgi:hypothetical protein
VNPRSARSQNEPQYVIFNEVLGDRRQSYATLQCWQIRICGESMAASTAGIAPRCPGALIIGTRPSLMHYGNSRITTA